MPSSSRLRTQSCHLLLVFSILLGSVPAPTHAATPSTPPTAAHRAVTGIPFHLPLASRPVGDLFPAPQAVLPAFDSPLPTPEPPGEQPSEPDAPSTTLDSPLSTPSAVLASPLALAAVAEPEGVLPGAVVTLTLALSNTGAVAVGGLAVQATLPDGLQWIPDQPGWAYDESTRRLSAEVGDLAPGAGVALAVCLRTGEQIAGPLALTWEAQSGEIVLASVRVPVWVARRVQATIGPDGGTLQSGDGRVRLEFPAGAVSRAAAVTLTAYLAHTPGTPVERAAHPKQGLVRFEIEATEASDGTRIASLDRPVQIVVDMRQLLPDSTGQGWYVAYRDPQDAGVWYGVETHVLDEAGLIGVTTDHFSVWSAGAENVGWRFVWQEPTVGVFSGAATYGYPIEVPPGRGGLQPNVDISYSSRGVDGQTACNVDQGPIGLGWSINDIEIAREGVHLKDRYGHVGLIHPDAFSLVLDGAGYELLTNENTANAVVRYYVTNAPQLFVERRYDASASDSNPDRIYWIVKTPEGTVYRLGRTSDSASGQSMGYNLIDTTGTQHEGYSTSYSGIRWLVDTVTDVYGNQVQYTYATWTEQNSYDSQTQDDQGQSHTTSSTTYHSRIRSIRYNYTTRATDVYTRVSGTYATLVDLIHTADHRIDQIKLYHGNLSQPYRLVDLGLGTVWQDCGESMKTDTLNSLTEFDGSGTVSLPAVTLSYVTLAHAWGNCYEYEHLQQVDNGYGGRVRFTYGAGDGRVSDGWQCNCVPEYGNTFVATQKETWDGLGVQPAVVEYAFATPCYDQYEGDVGDLAGAFNCPTRNDFSGYGHGGLVGFAVVTETVRGYQGEMLSRQRTWFSQARQTMGRPTLEEGFDVSGSLLRSVQTRNVTATVGPTTFSYASPVTTTDYGGGVSASHVVSYTYDTYGNVTAAYDYGGSAAGDERSVYRGFYPNSAGSVWIVDRPGWEKVYRTISGDVGGANLVVQTLNYYDGASAYTTPPLTGTLTQVRQGLDGWGYVTSTYAYDGWGNTTVVTDALGHAMRTTYESTYHLYPLQVCHALNRCTSSAYYGIGGVAADYGLPGQAKVVTDTNGAATGYRYDSLGRLTTVKAPYDAGWGDDQVSVRYWYEDLGNPPGTAGVYHQRIRSWRGGGGARELLFFDGLGRTVQTTVNDAVTDGVSLRTTTHYDALGQVVRVYAPISTTKTSSYTAPAGDAPRTTTQYDALGQAVRVTGPDGVNSDVLYGARWQMVQDGNRHLRLSFSDAYGRLAAVDETLVEWSDTFGDGIWSGWTVTATGTVTETGGVMRLTGNGSDWNTQVARTWLLSDGEGVTFDFKCDPAAAGVDSAAYLYSGTYGTSSYRRWGFEMDSTTIYLRAYEGTSPAQTTTLLALRTGVWYRALLKIGGQGEFITAVWERDNPAVRSVRREGRGSVQYPWYGQGWRFKAYVRYGTLTLDNYDELAFYTTRYAYDALDHLTRVTDTLGVTTSMTYDPLGRKTGMSDPDMGAWQYRYDVAGNLIKQQDARQQATCFYYDALNRLVGKTYHSNVSNLDTLTCAGTYAVSYGYDAGTNGLERRTGMTDTVGVTTWTYDQRGRVTQEVKTVTGAGTFATACGYDVLDRVITTTYPDNEVVTGTYNFQGLPVQVRSQTYGLNYASGAAYNALGQPTEMTLGSGVLVKWGYWGLGGPWDANPISGLTNYGRLRRIRSSASTGVPLAEWRYNYDLVGNVTRAVDVPREASNWPTSGFTFADTFDSKSTSNWTWSAYQTVPFDDGGNKVVKSSGTGSSWDAHFYRATYSLSHGEGLQVRFKVDQTNTLAHFSIEANDVAYLRFGARAENGRLIVQYNDSGGYRYPVDLLTNLQLNTWYVLRIAVDDSDRGFYVEAYQESAPTVRGSFNVYMPTGKTWRFHHWIYRGNAYLDDYREFSTGGLAWTPDEREGFTYDALDRLVGGSPVSGAQGYTVTYGYDPTGNITYATGLGTYVYTVTVSGCSAGTRSAKPHAVGRAGSNTYVYDCNGNVTRRVELSGTQTITYYQEYDAENRLVAVTNTVTSLVTRFAYDGDGQRVKVTAGTTTTVYVGNYYEKQGSTVTRYYYLGGQRVAMRVGPAGQAGTLSYLHGDHLGSTSLATNSGGGVVARQRYYPYGAVRPGGTGTLPTDYTFTGQKDVPGTGLMYYGARYYEPALGRFVSADTIVPEPGNPQDLNRYTYVRNDPLGYVDPSGHWLECGSYLGECKSDTNYAGVSVLNDDPEVQAYLDNAMDPHRYLASVEGHIVVAATNAVVDDVVGMIGWRLRQYFGPLARRVITRLLKTSDDVAAQFLDDAAWASQRAAELREQLGRSHDFGSTMAAATAYDENGTRHLIIGANEGRRSSVQLLPEEIFVGARGIDAEQSIVNFANTNNLQVSVVEATRPICPACEFYIVQAGGLPLTTKSGEVFLPVLWKW